MRAAGLLVALLAVLAASLVLVARGRLRASLPQVEGEAALPGLAGVVRVERDRLSVPTVRGGSRLDVARATGFLHAQERFFQMDLLRRRAAGELAELFGKAAVPVDREVRVLRLRRVARRALAALGDDRELLDAYAAGVDAGLRGLGAPPVEYVLLRASPRRWEAEDSLLCALAMYLTLQGRLPEDEARLAALHAALPLALFEFLTPRGTEWDAPLQGEPDPPPAFPGPETLDLALGLPSNRAAHFRPASRFVPSDEIVPGSNNWAVAGSRTVHGGAILANDMHLGLGVPNTWYRVRLVFPDRGKDAPEGEERQVAGVTLPGAPFVVVGSNGDVAWGFTNSQGDWADLVEIEPVPGDDGAYRAPGGPRRFETAVETIRVRDAADETVEVRSTVWGPIVDPGDEGRDRALVWVALREGGLNVALVRMEGVRDVEAALALAPEVGIPHQNLVVADAGGHIGWTIIGRIPRRVGFDGRLPVSWADGARGWDGWLDATEYPRIVDPPSGRIWTANARVVDGEALAVIGFGSYELGARARQIRDGLLAVERASEEDMLAIQLDDRALFLERWRDRALRVLDGTAAPEAIHREARGLLADWGGRAAVESVGYRIVRRFREEVAARALSPLVPAGDPDLDDAPGASRVPALGHRQWEGPLWALVEAQPPHLLDPRYDTWDALLADALDSTLRTLAGPEQGLSGRTWGEQNTTLVRHPLSRAVPALSRFLDMPPMPLPGDSHMPRVQHPSAGASERLVVSPGREERGLFHMPGGQSGHPLSPHYGDGHAAWARGEPTPFLPGPPVSVLTLRPAPR